MIQVGDKCRLPLNKYQLRQLRKTVDKTRPGRRILSHHLVQLACNPFTAPCNEAHYHIHVDVVNERIRWTSLVDLPDMT